MPLIPAKNNFADLRESVDKLLSSATDETLRRLIGLVGMISYRSNLLEREVELLSEAENR